MKYNNRQTPHEQICLRHLIINVHNKQINIDAVQFGELKKRIKLNNANFTVFRGE